VTALIDMTPQNYSCPDFLLAYTHSQPPPSKDEDAFVTKLRQRLKDALTEVRKGAE
jgi:hypothetical protein